MEERTLQLDAKPEAAAPEVAGAQLDDALKIKTQASLTNAMTYYLAWLVVEYGPGAAGHVLERMGSHISDFTERKRAVRKAEEAREAGRLVN